MLPGGGFGFVVRLAREGIAQLAGRTMTQPLSAAIGSSRKNQNHSVTNAKAQTPVS